MTDPKHIDEVLIEVRRVWRQCPELRLTQLLYNAVHEVRPLPPSPAFFCARESEVLAGLERLKSRFTEPQ